MSPGWEHARNLLCVRLDNLGDVLMTTPALRALRDSAPARRITLLTSGAGAAIAPLVPVIDDVIEYDAPWMKHAQARLDSILPLAERLRARRFDAAVIFTVYSQSPLPAALVCSAAGIALRLAHCRENPYLLLSDWVPEREPGKGVRHEVVRQLDLVRHVGSETCNQRLVLDVPDGARAWAGARLCALGIEPDRPWVLVHPGASAPSRRYPPELWAEALNRLAATHDCAVVFAGATAELAVIEAICARLCMPSVMLAGELDLPRLAALVSLAPVLLCNNSGPAHMAAALGTPVVDLYALTNPQHTPWQVPQRVLFRDVPCRFCQRSECPEGHHECMVGIDPQGIAQAAGALLAGAATQCGEATPTIIELLEAANGHKAIH